MAVSRDSGLQRINFPYFEGVNTIVEHTISKKVEPELAENARSVKVGSIEKRRGFTALGNNISATANYGLFYFEGTTSMKYLYRISTVAGQTNTYYLSNASAWTVLAGAGSTLSAAKMSIASAENCLFMVNGTDVNRYVGSDGLTVTPATTVATTNHMYLSPKAYKVNYYKDKLYLGDIYLGTNRIKNGVAFSSKPVGIVSLVSGDFATGVVSLDVTDTKYIYASDTLDVIRGGVRITTVTVTAKTEYAITVNATGADIKSSDELWVANTYDGTAPMVFRWASVASGTNAKRYDTFKMAGGSSSPVTMLTNIGDVMAIATKDSFMTWNDSSLTSYHTRVGCVSDNGYVEVNNLLMFIHYTGVYATSGGAAKLVSSKVQEFFDGATKAGLEAASVGKKGLSVFFGIGDVTLYNEDGSTYKTLSDVVLEYNMRQENWFVHTGIPAAQFITYINSTDPDDLVFSNSTNFKIYEFLKGYDDDGAAIPFNITTSIVTLNPEFEKISYPRFLILDAEAGNTLKIFVSMDNDSFYGLESTVNKGCERIAVTPKEPNDEYARCRKIRISIKEFSKGICKISRMALLYSLNEEYEEHSS